MAEKVNGQFLQFLERKLAIHFRAIVQEQLLGENVRTM